MRRSFIVDINVAKLLKHKHLNGWGLFWLLSVPISLSVIIHGLQTDLSTGEGVSEMIGYSVRWAVPFIYLVIAASAVQILFPGPFSMWLLRNRKYLGLVFAVAMAWQGLGIFVVSTIMRDYYFSEIYAFRDELEGTIGYVFLATLSITSFKIGSRFITSDQWKLIHKAGVIFLWAYPFSVYWWNLFYYPYLDGYASPRVIDYFFYAGGFAAFALRLAAWGKIRLMKSAKEAPGVTASRLARASGGALIVLGLVSAVTGHLWYNSVAGILAGPSWSEETSLWLPFWPLEPFLPLLIIGLGIMLATSVQTAGRSTPEAVTN
ncbi:MAG: hypothetical protein AAFX52_07080 [Pseudomonadota bacterium]